LEQEQLFFLAHPEGGRELSEVQLIRHAIQKLRACGPLYGRALSVWNSKDSDYRKVWANFRATIEEQYVEMLARRGDTTLAEDGYAAYNAMAEEDNAALSENLVQYAERSARAEARVSDIEAQLETLTMNAQPLGLGLPGQAYGMNYAHNAMQAPPGLYGHHGNAYYAPQQDPGRHMYRHPGPFGTPGQWTQYAQASGQASSESTKRRKIGNHGREQWNDNSANQFQTSGQGSNGFGRGGGGRGMGSNGGRVNLDPLFNGNSGRGAYTNTLKTFDNLKYCPNKGCGYDVDHMGYECPY